MHSEGSKAACGQTAQTNNAAKESMVQYVQQAHSWPYNANITVNGSNCTIRWKHELMTEAWGIELLEFDSSGEAI